jgi:general stress protein CsbA
MTKVIREGLVYITCHLHYYHSVFWIMFPIKSFTAGYLSTETKLVNLHKMHYYVINEALIQNK